MFIALKGEVEERFEAIEEFLKAINGLKRPQAMVVAKGLAFVQVYAVYEDTVRKTVSEAIDRINTHNHEIRELSSSLMTLFLDPEIRSLRDSGPNIEWRSRIKLFKRAFSRQKADLSSDTALPTDGTHFRFEQLALIFEVFGIKRLPVRRLRHKQRIREVVDNRNAIAHGGETPEAVGRRYTRDDIRKVIKQMRSVCLLWVQVFDDYCANPTRHLR